MILLLGADFAFTAFFEKGIGVVVAWIVVAEVIVPITLLDAVGKVHFAEDGDFVARFAKNVGEERNVGGQGNVEALVGQRSGGVGVHAGHRYGTSGSAEGIGAEGVAKEDAFTADTVVIWCLQDRIACDRESVGALAFAEEKDEVRVLRFRLCRYS